MIQVRQLVVLKDLVLSHSSAAVEEHNRAQRPTRNGSCFDPPLPPFTLVQAPEGQWRCTSERRATTNFSPDLPVALTVAELPGEGGAPSARFLLLNTQQFLFICSPQALDRVSRRRCVWEKQLLGCSPCRCCSPAPGSGGRRAPSRSLSCLLLWTTCAHKGGSACADTQPAPHVCWPHFTHASTRRRPCRVFKEPCQRQFPRCQASHKKGRRNTYATCAPPTARPPWLLQEPLRVVDFRSLGASAAGPVFPTCHAFAPSCADGFDLAVGLSTGEGGRPTFATHAALGVLGLGALASLRASCRSAGHSSRLLAQLLKAAGICCPGCPACPPAAQLPPSPWARSGAAQPAGAAQGAAQQHPPRVLPVPECRRLHQRLALRGAGLAARQRGHGVCGGAPRRRRAALSQGKGGGADAPCARLAKCP